MTTPDPREWVNGRWVELTLLLGAHLWVLWGVRGGCLALRGARVTPFLPMATSFPPSALGNPGLTTCPGWGPPASAGRSPGGV